MNIDENKREIYNKTLDHKKDVSEKLNRLINAIEERKETHDNSKLEEPEITKFQEFLIKIKTLSYGSEEYLDLVKNSEYTKLHFINNKHHPEHHRNGINDMDIVDIIEMLCDWLSAKNRNLSNYEIDDFFRIQQNRYKFSDDLLNILVNTAKTHFKS